MRRNYKKLTVLFISTALLVSFTGCSKNALQTDGSTGAAESDSISVSDNDTETVINSMAEEETQEQSAEGDIEKSTAATDEANPASKEETEIEVSGEETSGVVATSDKEESSTDKAIASETTLMGTAERESTTKDAETVRTVATVQSIKASVSGTHYIGDTLTGADITVVVTMSDGSTITNPAGWSASPLMLTGSSNQITVAYEGVSTTVTVKASEKPAETTVTPQQTTPPTTTQAPPETTAPAKTYGLDAVPEGLELKGNYYNSTCLLSLEPIDANGMCNKNYYNGDIVSRYDYTWTIGYVGNNGYVEYVLSDVAVAKITGFEDRQIADRIEFSDFSKPWDTKYTLTAYYGNIVFEKVWVPRSEGYRPDTYDDEAAQLEFALFNQERNSIGLTSLVWNDTLAELAKIRAKELESDYSHDESFYAASEIITFGFNSEDAQALARGTFASWKGSKGHYNVILDPWQEMCGIAYYRSVDGKVYTVALLTGSDSPIFDGVIIRESEYKP